MLWVGGSAAQIAAVDLPAKIFWFKFQGVCQLPTITAITCFLLEFAWPGRYLTRRNLILLSIPCLLFLGMVLTNSYFHLAWHGFTYDGLVVPNRAVGNWIFVAYGYGLALVNIIVFIWLFSNSPKNRWMVVLMLVGLVATRSIYILEATGYINSIFPIDVLVIAIPFFIYAIVFFHFHILDPIPFARQMVIDQFEAGLLIADSQKRIISVNPVGASILGGSNKQIIGEQIQNLLPECSGLMESPHISRTNRTEISLKNGSETRHYQLGYSALIDWRGLIVGHLIMLQDITAQNLAQAKLVEQQRAMATLKEREQVARELHDVLSQELAFINVQAQLVSGLLEAGEQEKVLEQLQLLAKAARHAQVDVRGQIGKLSFSIEPEEGFLGVLNRFLDMFQQMYGIETEMIFQDSNPTISLASMVKVQLLRIVQEAFTNVHKHAQAEKVILSLTREADFLELIIQDDGIGFDPGDLPSDNRSFGLKIISARAEDVGGSLVIDSKHGQGTRIVVIVPCSKEVV
jgi:signal transduction histidine kinase